MGSLSMWHVDDAADVDIEVLLSGRGMAASEVSCQMVSETMRWGVSGTILRKKVVDWPLLQI